MNQQFLDNDYVVAILALVVGMYAATVGLKTQLPGYIRNLFNNPIFRVVFITLLLVHNYKKAPHAALAVSLILVITLQTLSQQETYENFVYLQSYKSQNKKK